MRILNLHYSLRITWIHMAKIVLASNSSISRLLPCIKLRLNISTIQNSFCVMLTFLFVIWRHFARNVLQTIISRGKGGSWWHLLLDGYLLIVHTTVPPVGTILEKNRKKDNSNICNSRMPLAQWGRNFCWYCKFFLKILKQLRINKTSALHTYLRTLFIIICIFIL